MPDIEPYIRLVCEGLKTEPNYFNSLLRSVGIKRANPALKAKDHSPLGVAREAIMIYKEAIKDKIPKAKIFVFAVFDRDGHTGVPDAIEMLRGTPVKAIFSNVCFEFWILLHFERSQRPFADCDDLITYIENNYIKSYTKSGDIFPHLKHRIPEAIRNANWLNDVHWRYEDRPIWERNPYTNVNKAVEMIQRPLKEWLDIFNQL
ncbi:MAG: RloB family protein [Bacteroidota bacterium]